MVNDPKEDNDLENNDNSETEELSETDESTEESTVEEAESTASGDEDSDLELAENEQSLTEATDEVEDAVLVEDDELLENDAEVVSEPELAEPEVTEVAATPEPQPAKKSGMGAVFGGLIAGAIGFLAATFGVPEGWPNATQSEDSELAEQLAAATTGLASANEGLAAQTSRSDELQAELETLKQSIATASDGQEAAPSVDIEPINAAIASVTAELGSVTSQVSESAAQFESVESSLAEITSSLSALEESFGGFEERLAAVEERPSTLTFDGSEAMEAQLQTFRAELDAVTAAARAEIEASNERASLIEAEALAAAEEAEARASQIEAEALAAEELANQRAAVAEIKAALESGGPFNEALAVLPDAPSELSAVAEEGVTTLASLQSDFPLAARTALASDEAVPEDADAGDKLAAFLRRQTNARSLAPKEGDDTNAILSRAEATLNEGDLEAALAELGSLGEGPKSAMSSWVESAQARVAALVAADALLSATN